MSYSNVQVKYFSIRLDANHIDSDESIVNEFLNNPNMEIVRSGVDLIRDSGEVGYWSILFFYKMKSQKEVSEPKPQDRVVYSKDSALTSQEQMVFDALKKWRMDKAKQINMPAYIVASDAELVSVIKTNPHCEADLLSIKGFGQQKIAKYGSDIIALLNSI